MKTRQYLAGELRKWVSWVTCSLRVRARCNRVIVNIKLITLAARTWATPCQMRPSGFQAVTILNSMRKYIYLALSINQTTHYFRQTTRQLPPWSSGSHVNLLVEKEWVQFVLAVVLLWLSGENDVFVSNRRGTGVCWTRFRVKYRRLVPQEFCYGWAQGEKPFCATIKWSYQVQILQKE